MNKKIKSICSAPITMMSSRRDEFIKKHKTRVNKMVAATKGLSFEDAEDLFRYSESVFRQVTIVK